MSGKVLSLSQARKAKSKVKKHAQSAVNAAKFGQTGAQKNLSKIWAEKAARSLDGHIREE